MTAVVDWVLEKTCKGSMRLFTEYVSWFLVNCLICQLPLLFMWINAADVASIFSGFLSYVFTFMISSYYTLMSLRATSFRNGWYHVLGWVAVVYLVIIFGILSVYPKIGNVTVKAVLVDKPFYSYLVLFSISTILSYMLCVPALTEKSKELAEDEKATQPFRNSEAMDPNNLKSSIEGDDDDEE